MPMSAQELETLRSRLRALRSQVGGAVTDRLPRHGLDQHDGAALPNRRAYTDDDAAAEAETSMDIAHDARDAEEEIKTDHPGGDISRQDGKVEAAIFAIVQETVNNAIKHAQAQNIVVELQETLLTINTIIADDGQGFNVDKVLATYEHRGSLGMVNIREGTELIGGELDIKSAPGKGTRITIHVPKEEELRLKKRSPTGPLVVPADRLPPG